GGGSDANFTADRVPTLDGLGVDGHGAHTLEEHLLISSLVPRFLLQRRLMETLE
ncbi:MAG TPA: M20 family peptidase, partial [Hyphomicrobiaceae bacterium]|nr:M20 family peptidase [Hyphomicrobiaceae bacterium]